MLSIERGQLSLSLGQSLVPMRDVAEEQPNLLEHEQVGRPPAERCLLEDWPLSFEELLK